MLPKNNIFTSTRRRFLSNTIKLALLGSLLPFHACTNKSERSTGKKDSLNKKGPIGQKTGRRKWNHEGLVMNTKTKVLHFPTRKVYHYYDEITPGHLQQVGLTAWAGQLDGPARLNKEQSGNILELLAMQQLKDNINDQALAAATDTISKAFDKECENAKGVNSNMFNFRLHELMLQLVTLNNNIAPDQKWNAFNTRIKKPGQLRKRQAWMATESSFNDRVNYILERREEYLNRLKQRTLKYSFT